MTAMDRIHGYDKQFLQFLHEHMLHTVDTCFIDPDETPKPKPGPVRNNQKRAGRSTSDYRGVSFHKASGKWRVTVTDPSTRKGRSAGYFECELVAAKAYDAKAIRLYGKDRALLNFPEDHLI